MKARCGIVFAAVTAAVSLPLLAGVDIATSEAYDGVLVDTSGKPIALSTLSDVEAFAARPVTYREGETVTAFAPDGSGVALVPSPAPADGGVLFSPSGGGVWRLVNSSGDNVAVGVAWGVFGDGWSVDFASTLRVRAHTLGDGPDRRVKLLYIPPVAYSGDDWIGDIDAASSITFIAPSGREAQFDKEGTGAFEFNFNENGLWNVRLAMEGDLTREAEVMVSGTGFFVIFP